MVQRPKKFILSKTKRKDFQTFKTFTFRPPTPEMEEVEEEPFVEVRAENGGVMATPFFSQDNGTTLIRWVAWWHVDGLH